MHLAENKLSCLGYKKPPPGEWIMRPGWTMPAEPCRKGHLAPRNRFGHCMQCYKDYRASKGHFSGLPSSKKWRAENRERMNALRRLWNASNTERCTLARAKRNAKKRGVPFDLDVSDIVIPETCPVLGIPLVSAKGIYADNSPSLDRIVPSKGYVKGNIIVVSWRANRIKNDASCEELRRIADFYAVMP